MGEVGCNSFSNRRMGQNSVGEQTDLDIILSGMGRLVRIPLGVAEIDENFSWNG